MVCPSFLRQVSDEDHASNMASEGLLPTPLMFECSFEHDMLKRVVFPASTCSMLIFVHILPRAAIIFPDMASSASERDISDRNDP